MGKADMPGRCGCCRRSARTCWPITSPAFATVTFRAGHTSWRSPGYACRRGSAAMAGVRFATASFRQWSIMRCKAACRCSPVSSPPSFAKPFSQWAGALRRSARREPIRAVPSEPFASTSVPTRRRCSPRMASIRPARSRRSQPNWREEGDMTHDPARLAAMLLADGYCIVKDAIAPDAIAAIEADLALRFEATPFCEGGFYGARTKRFGALLRRSRHAAALVRHPLILTIAETILGQWCDRIALNLTQAVEIHPGAFAQAPHRDQDLWGGDKTGMEYQLNVIWPVDPFTADNGATRLWPGSHRDDAVDPFAIAPIAAEMAPGSALLL